MNNSLIKYFSLCLLWVSILSCAQSKKEIIPQTYVAHKISEVITIDGKANESVWKKAKWTNNFIDIEGDIIPKYQTNVKMLWDESYYYILAEIKEPHVWGDITERDAVIFYNNDFEVFIDPDGDTHNYYEIEINALNTVWDLFISKPYRIGNNVVLNDWDIKGLKSAVSIDGTLNNSNDTDKGWTLEIAIPFKNLGTTNGKNKFPGDQFWRVNFSRVNWNYDLENGIYSRKKGEDGKYLSEYNWVWSPIGVINMHLPENWGYVYFSSDNLESDITFTIPQDEKVKWKLYELFRANRAYHSGNKRWATSINDLTTSEIIVGDKVLKPTLEYHNLGWTISVQSPFTNRLLSVREDSQFSSRKM